MLLIVFRAGVNTAHHISDSFKLMLNNLQVTDSFEMKNFSSGFQVTFLYLITVSIVNLFTFSK